MINKILLTGGTGFLGSYILAALVQQGYTVYALRRDSTIPHWIDPAVMGKVQWINGDVLDIVGLEEAMENIDAVIHAAAIISFTASERKALYQINVEGTANIVNACLEKKVNRLVHISSVAALGRKVGGGHVDETAKWEENPLQTHYARSKYKAELHVWRGHCEGLDTVILNPSTILGFGDWTKSSCAIFKQMHDGFKWYTPGLNGFVDVQDVAKATLLLLEEGKNGERYVVNGDTWSFQKLQAQIANGFNKPVPRLKANAFILGLAWRIEAIRSMITGKKPLLTRESAQVAQSKTAFDKRKLLSTFPSFQYTPLTKTIEQACARYSQHYA